MVPLFPVGSWGRGDVMATMEEQNGLKSISESQCFYGLHLLELFDRGGNSPN